MEWVGYVILVGLPLAFIVCILAYGYFIQKGVEKWRRR